MCDCRFELALGWYGDLDGYDITALGLLSRGPTVSPALLSHLTYETIDPN